MDCLEQAKRLYVICVENASIGSLVTYRDALSSLGYGSKVSEGALSDGLKLLWLTCIHSGIPSPAPIIVSNISDEAVNERRASEIQKVFDYVAWPEVEEIDWDYVWENRAELYEQHSFGGNNTSNNKKNVTRIRPALSFIEEDEPDDDPPFGGAMSIRA